MHISCACYSGLGKRANNEDAFLAAEFDGGLLAVVADGLGGQDNGEYASRRAVQVLRDRLAEESVSAAALEEAIAAANEEICALHDAHPGAQTTIAALWLGEGRAEAMHVGDTRIYQFRDGGVLYQSVDHSIAQLGVMAGDLKPEEIRSHRDRNKLFRALGVGHMPKIAEKTLRVQAGDRLLLCSDGFWEGILEEEMLRCAEENGDAEGWLKSMREIAEPAAGDNNTAVAIVID